MLLITAACADHTESQDFELKLVHDQHNIQFVWNVAVLANEPNLCGKIPSDRAQRLGFNPKGKQIYYERSRCYYDVALAFGDIKLCDRVKEKTPSLLPFLSGSNVSRTACEEKVRIQLKTNNKSSSMPSMASGTFLQQMHMLGYTDETAHEHLPVPALQPDYSKMWKEIAHHTDLANRVTKVSNSRKSWDHSSDVTVAEHDFVLSMAAALSQSIDWCSKMSNGSRVPATYNMKAHSFKNYCILDVARRTDCRECCEKIVHVLSEPKTPVLPSGRRRPEGAGYDRVMYLSCVQATTDDSLYGDGELVHQIVNPLSDEHTKRFIELLGYPLPTIADLSAYEKQKRYRRLFMELGKNPKLKHDPQVKRLFEKIYKLEN